jgi:protein TonB
MSAKIKFNIFNTLFRLFSFLADKTNGWMVFVKPKLLFGSLIMGLGISACSVKDKSNNTSAVVCYDTTSVDIVADTNFVVKNPDSIAPAISDTIITPSRDLFEVMCYVYHDFAPDDTTANINSIVEGIDSIPPEEIYVTAEQMPQFPGGEQAMRSYLREKLHYPIIAREDGIEGKVCCAFIVEKDGVISNIEVIRSVDPALDKEAVRVIRRMPRWIPGREGGKPVRIKYTLPIRFKLEE